MRNKILNSAIILVAVTLLSVLAFYVKDGATADSVAVLRTTGMTCGSCSNKITAALGGLKGVVATEVDVNGGWVIVGYDPSALKPEALAEKVKVAGFESNVHQVLTPEQFRQIAGRSIGQKKGAGAGCGSGGCGGPDGCGMNRQTTEKEK
ncbi:MAG: heavy metal transporter [Geobacteraceae bacterium GWC2_48_7]|nr:MAG: heavy metal transporter [Geobacteraceae bacterium GWC2_48_7]